MKLKIDGYAEKAMKSITSDFCPYFGQCVADSGDLGGVVFNAPPSSLKKITIKSLKKKLLLSGRYNLQLAGEVPKEGLVKSKKAIKFGYKGFFLKGKAFFHHHLDEYKNVINALNNDSQIIEALTSIDIEFGEIAIENGKYIIKFVPMRGSYLYMVFPPMKYTGRIPKEEVNKLADATRRISEILKKTDVLSLAS